MKELGNGYAYRMSDDAMVINMVNDSVRKRRQEAENRELLAQDHRRREAREQGRWQRKERRAIAQCCGGGAVIALTYFEMCRGNITPQLAVSLIIGALVFVCVRGGWYPSHIFSGKSLCAGGPGQVPAAYPAALFGAAL